MITYEEILERIYAKGFFKVGNKPDLFVDKRTRLRLKKAYGVDSIKMPLGYYSRTGRIIVVFDDIVNMYSEGFAEKIVNMYRVICHESLHAQHDMDNDKYLSDKEYKRHVEAMVNAKTVLFIKENFSMILSDIAKSSKTGKLSNISKYRATCLLNKIYHDFFDINKLASEFKYKEV